MPVSFKGRNANNEVEPYLRFKLGGPNNPVQLIRTQLHEYDADVAHSGCRTLQPGPGYISPHVPGETLP